MSPNGTQMPPKQLIYIYALDYSPSFSTHRLSVCEVLVPYAFSVSQRVFCALTQPLMLTSSGQQLQLLSLMFLCPSNAIFFDTLLKS